MTDGMYMSRRELLAAAAALTVSACIPRSLLAAVSKGEMPYRRLGRTGERVSLIGLGGYHIGNHRDHPHGHRQWHQLHGQLLGLQ